MKQSTAQNATTVVFIAFMLINIWLASGYHEGASFLKPFLAVYGIHLTIILTYYFMQEPIADKLVARFKFFLLLGLLLIWNGIVALITVDAGRDLQKLQVSLTEFPEYAGFLIAAGIIWLFGGVKSALLGPSE